MRLKQQILVIKRSEITTSKKGNKYFTVTIADSTGEVFNVTITDLQKYDQFQPFNQLDVTIEVKNTNYGIKLNIL